MPRVTATMVLLSLLSAGLVAAACGSAERFACPDGLEPHTEFNLYFGQEQGDGTELSSEEWETFLAEVVTPSFPDGLTVYDARGQWLDTEADRLYRESTKVLNILVPVDRTAEAKQSLDQIADTYVEEFDQQVVFKTSRESCAGF